MAIFKSKQQRGAVSKKPTKPSRQNIPRVPLLPVLGAVGLLFIAVVIYQQLQSVLSQPVDRVAITGTLQHIDKNVLIEQLKPMLNEGFVLLDLDAIRKQLEQEPWIDQVRVVRRWPNQVLIDIREQQPIARWGQAGFLNHRGQLFEPRLMPKVNNLPLLDGPVGESEQVMNNFRSLTELLRERNLQLYSLLLDERGNWVAVLEGDVKITLGQDQIMSKMRRFMRSYQNALVADFERVESIDMRYSNGLAVAWKQQG